MYEIAVLELKKTVKFNKSIEGDEISLKVIRNKSVSGIKTPIDTFDFSNENKYFVVACENTKIKIFQNFGNFEESKSISEFTAKEVKSFSHDKITMYISSMFNGKLTGYIAASNESDIFIYDIDGNLIKVIKNAHDGKICLLKLAKKGESSDECVLISGSRDGRFYVWKI
jgi:WD40 repeat protein